jgi:AcrR family transcriptional regulator
VKSVKDFSSQILRFLVLPYLRNLLRAVDKPPSLKIQQLNLIERVQKLCYTLNMFKSLQDEARATKDLIYQTALALFRQKGLESTTMREIAKTAGMSLGSTYHYFPSKEAIVAEYYQEIQKEHRERVLQSLPKAKNLRERLALAFHSHTELIRQDRLVLGGVLKFVGEPNHPLSVLGKGTADIQKQSLETYRLVLEGHLPKDLMELAPQFLWTLHMGFILYFIYDDSPGQTKTKKLMDDTLELVSQFFALNTNPMLQPLAKPIRERIKDILNDADLMMTSKAL